MRLTRTLEVRRRWLAIAALALLCALPSHSQVRPSDEPTSGNIGGTVLNSVTHESIGRALVYSPDGRFAIFTDDHGHFELSGVAPTPIPGQPNTYNSTMLWAKKPGFLSDASLQRGGEVIVAGQQEITLSLVPESLIVGHVKFPTAETAERVPVQLYRRDVRDGFATWAPLTATETRSDGEYRFAGLRAGEYSVFTSESQDQDPLAAVPNGPVFVFPPRYFADGRDFSTADIIRVRAGDTFIANIALESQQYFDVKVPVAGLDPAIPMGLEVSVYAQGHRGPGFELGYDQSLGAVIGSLPNGTYTIEASSQGPTIPATGMVNITVSNRPVNGPVLAVVPNTNIEVNVHQDMTGADEAHRTLPVSSQNEPAAYIMLMSADDTSGQRSMGQTFRAEGNPPVLSGIAPGRYWVQIQNGYGYAAYITSGSRDLLRLPLIVPYGASVPPIEITLRYDTGDIEVVVERSTKLATAGATPDPSSNIAATTGANLRGLSVYCLPTGDAGGTPREAYGGRNGRYGMDRLPPGDYRILAFDTPQQFEYRDPAAMRAYESKGKVVHVSPGQKTQVRIHVIESE